MLLITWLMIDTNSNPTNTSNVTGVGSSTLSDSTLPKTQTTSSDSIPSFSGAKPEDSSGFAPEKATIRTMQDDLKGSSPSQTYKASPILQSRIVKEGSNSLEIKTVFKPKEQIDFPKVQTSTPSLMHITDNKIPKIGLGIEKESITSISSQPSITKPVLQPIKSSIQVPSQRHSSHTPIIIAVAVLLIALIVLFWFFVFIGDDTNPTPSEIVSLTPTAIITPPSTPIEVEFGNISNLVLFEGADPNVQLTNAIDLKRPISGDVQVYNIVDSSDVSAIPYSFDRFSSKFLLNSPNEVISSIDTSELYYTLFGDSTDNIARGFIVRVTNPGLIAIGMEKWEPTLPLDLEEISLLNIADSSSPNFIDVTYQGTPVHYRNFPDPFSTVDYAVVQLDTGEYYLLITNTRDHIFALIDILTDSLLGK